jgi:hypothetical protein
MSVDVIEATELHNDYARANHLANRLTNLADRVFVDSGVNPTALLCIRSAGLSAAAILRFREQWLMQLLSRRRESADSKIIELIEATRALVVARQADLSEKSLAQNRELGAALAKKLNSIQPGKARLSHYCSRRTGPDTELLAVEFYARALDWPFIDGMEDYYSAMYCICRRSDLRFRLVKDAVPKLRELAADWRAVCTVNVSVAKRVLQ